MLAHVGRDRLKAALLDRGHVDAAAHSVQHVREASAVRSEVAVAVAMPQLPADCRGLVVGPVVSADRAPLTPGVHQHLLVVGRQLHAQLFLCGKGAKVKVSQSRPPAYGPMRSGPYVLLGDESNYVLCV